MAEIYFDNGATTRVFPEVKEIMSEVMEIEYGNPSSMHLKGFHAEQYVNKSKEIIAKSLKVDPKDIYFTSGGTEANNMALIGAALAGRRTRRHIITTRIEHASIYNPLGFLEDEGFEVTYLPVDEKGIVLLDALKEALRPDTLMVSIMCVNNEIGSIMPIEEIGKIVKAYDPEILFHTDCIQAYGKLKLFPKKWKVDMLSVSGHKIHGPKGIGFIYIRNGVKIKPIIWGGNQQKGMRSGTENVPGIAGLGKAAEIIYTNHKEKMDTIRGVKEHFIERVVNEVENVKNNSGEAPHICSISFPGVRSEVLLHSLEDRGIYVSAGSACSSNKPEVSGTLRGIGLERDYYESTLRFSFSLYNTVEEADQCVEALKELVPVLRKYKRR
ncbi:MAG: cysteine desulfurase family protein [Eubacteriales bacterium]|nr:cysteine desulfurase family protein [Eubacteriales bacterium]